MADEIKNEGKSGSLKELVTAEAMVQLALALPAGCLIGWVVGEALDKHFQAHWMGITGILLGATAGFVQIFRVASKYLNRGSH